MPQTPTARPKPLQILLGLFIIWQLLFLFGSNATQFLLSSRLTEEENHLSGVVVPVLSVVKEGMDGWVQFTGQEQNWRLFAPEVPSRALFVAVELRWDAERYPPQHLSGHFEPPVPGTYLRLPGSGDRLWHAEKTLAWPLVAWDPQQVATRPDEWHQYLTDSIGKQWRAYRAYLAWRLQEFRQLHPDLPPPQELRMSVRVYPLSAQLTSPPAKEEKEVLLLRWRPEEPASGCLPIEIFNEAAGQFVPLSASQVGNEVPR